MASPGTWQLLTYDGMQYELLLPANYSPNEQYPLMVFLHGGGQEGEIPALIDPWFNSAEFRADYPTIVIAPILPNASTTVTWGGYPVDGTANSAGENQALAIVQNVMSTYPVDPSKVDVTGLSLGGVGTWDLMLKYNAYNGPDGRIFAAGLSLVGGEWNTANGANTLPTPAQISELQNVPIWAISPNNQSDTWNAQVAADMPPNSAYHFTFDPNVFNEDVWDVYYPLPTGAPMYNWMFSQQASALVTPPVVTGTAASAISDASTVAPFSQVAVSNVSVGAPAVATVTLSSVANGTLGNLGGGNYDASTGVYTFSGDATAISATLDGLVFAPTLHEAGPGQTVTTTFTLQITDSDGASVTNASASVTATGSPAGPATVTGVGGVTLSIPFGSLTLTLLQPLLTSVSGLEAGGSIVPALASSPPTVASGHSGLLQIDSSGVVVMPAGYQYAIDDASAAVTVAGGTSNGQLVVAGEDGLLFSAGTGAGSVFAGGGNNVAYVGSGSGSQFIALGDGADTINAATGNNTILGGAGSNLIFLGSGQNNVDTQGSDTLVSGTGTGFATLTGGQSLVFGSFTNVAGTINVLLGGAQATISAVNSATSVTTNGADGLVFGSFGSISGGLNVTDTGHATTITAGYFGAAATLAGTNALVFGDFTNTPGAIGILDQGDADTISAANSAISATLSGSQAWLFGGYGSIAGALNVVDTGHGDTIATGNSNATISGGAGGSGLLVFGGTGALNFVGGSGPATVVAGSGASTITGGSTGNELAAGSGRDVIAAGQGDDTLVAGSGTETLTGGAGADIFLFVSGHTAANAVSVQDFTANDVVYLLGYGANDAATALSNASSSGGSTTITLADHTQVTFIGIAGAAALQTHVASY